MAKKLTALLFTLFLAAVFGSAAYASEGGETEKGLQIINETNVLIDTEIDTASDEAAALLNTFLNDISGVKGADKLGKLYEKQVKAEAELADADGVYGEEARTKLAKIEAEISAAAGTLSKSSPYFAEVYSNYVSELDTLISTLDILTRQMTADAIAEAAQYGVLAECEWKFTKLGHKWVWIDPIRVVGV